MVLPNLMVLDQKYIFMLENFIHASFAYIYIYYTNVFHAKCYKTT